MKWIDSNSPLAKRELEGISLLQSKKLQRCKNNMGLTDANLSYLARLQNIDYQDFFLVYRPQIKLI